MIGKKEAQTSQLDLHIPNSPQSLDEYAKYKENRKLL